MVHAQVKDGVASLAGDRSQVPVSPAPFLTVEELVARWFAPGSTANTDKTNRDNVRDLISSGVLPGRKIGRRWYVHVRAVEAYEAGRDDPVVMRHPETRRFLEVAAGGGRS